MAKKKKNLQAPSSVTLTPEQLALELMSDEERKVKGMGWEDKFGTGIIEGLKKTGQGVAQGLYHAGSGIQRAFGVEPRSPIAESLGLSKDTEEIDQWVREKAKEREPYEKHGGGWYTAGDIAGQTIGTAPLMALPGGQSTALGRAGMGSVAGGGMMATQPVTDGNYAKGKTEQVGLGAVTGAGVGVVLPPVLNKAVDMIAKGYQGGLNVIRGAFGKTLHNDSKAVVDKWMEEANIEISHLTDEAKESFYKQIAEQLQAPPVATTRAGREAVESARRLPHKVDLTKGQITKKFEDVSKEDSLAKIDYLGDPLRQRKMEQNKAMVDNLDYLQGRKGNTPRDAIPEAEDIGARYSQFKDDRLSKLQKEEVSPAYNKITEEYGDDFVKLNSVEAKIMELKDSGAYYRSKKIKDVADELSTWVNVSRDPKAFASTAGEGLSGRLNVRQAENYRTTTKEFADDWTPTESKFINQLMDSLEDDVVNAVGKDVYDPARKVAQKRFGEKSAYDLPKSKSTADTVKKVKQLKEPELKIWADTMNGTRDGHTIFQDTRGRILEDIIEDSLNKSQGDALGYAMFDQRVFANRIGALGKKRRDILFSPQENQIIEDLLRVGQRRVPPQGATNPSGTGQAFFNGIQMLAQSIPFSGAIGNILKATLGKITGGIGDAVKGRTGKAVDEALHPFRRKPGSKRPKLQSRGRHVGVVTANELMENN